VIVRRSSVEPISFHGLRIRDYTAGLGTPSSLASIEVPPGVAHPEAYSLRSDKYYYVAAGKLTFMVDGEEQDLKPGDFCFIPRGRHFRYENRTARPATLVLVHTPSFDIDSEVLVE